MTYPNFFFISLQNGPFYPKLTSINQIIIPQTIRLTSNTDIIII